MSIKSRILDKKVLKIGKNRGFGGFFKGKRGVSWFWGIKSRSFDDFGIKKGDFLKDFP